MRRGYLLLRASIENHADIDQKQRNRTRQQPNISSSSCGRCRRCCWCWCHYYLRPFGLRELETQPTPPDVCWSAVHLPVQNLTQKTCRYPQQKRHQKSGIRPLSFWGQQGIQVARRNCRIRHSFRQKTNHKTSRKALPSALLKLTPSQSRA